MIMRAATGNAHDIFFAERSSSPNHTYILCHELQTTSLKPQNKICKFAMWSSFLCLSLFICLRYKIGEWDLGLSRKVNEDIFAYFVAVPRHHFVNAKLAKQYIKAPMSGFCANSNLRSNHVVITHRRRRQKNTRQLRSLPVCVQTTKR